MSKAKILFLQPTFDTSFPRNIRTDNITSKLKDEVDIYLFCFNNYATPKIRQRINILRLDYSWISNKILNKGQSGYKPRGLVSLVSRGLSYLLKLFIKPDPWFFEKTRIINFIKSQNSLNELDSIVCSMFPFSMAEVGIELKAEIFPKARLIFDIGDPYSNNAANTKSFSKRHKNYEKNLLKKADHIVVTNFDTMQYYIMNLQIDRDRISIISQGVDSNLFFPKKNMIGNLRSGILRIVYAGTFYKKLRDPSKFLTCISSYSNFEIFIFGGAHEIKANNIFYKNKVIQKNLVDHLHNGDILLFIDNAFGMQTSGKIFELLALKMPILFIYENCNSKVYLDCQKYDNILFVKNTINTINQALDDLTEELIATFRYDYSVEDLSWSNRAIKMKNIL